MTPNSNLRSRLTFATLLTFASGLPLFGQATPATPPAPSTPESDTLQLSPFEVRTDKDTGYTATNTLAGSRLNTSLRDTPAAISVFTKEFLDDIGAINVTEALEYGLNGSKATTD